MSPSKEKTLFVYECADQNGRLHSGEIWSHNITYAKAELRKQGLIPKKINKKKQFNLRLGKKSPSSKDITLFTRQFATMVNAGLPIVQSLDIIAKGTEREGLRKILEDIKNDIESGTQLYKSFNKYPKYFEGLYCHFIEAGEQSGTLSEMLLRIADYREKMESLKRKIRKALFYPSAVLFVAFVVTAILLLFVVPQFKEIFASFNAELPVFTQFVLYISELFQNYWYWFLGLLGVLIYTIKYLLAHSQSFRNSADHISLKIPIFGTLMRKAIVARFARTLATTFAAGVSLGESLNSVKSATSNIVYQRALSSIHDKVQSGITLNIAMKESLLFPIMVVQMVAIGEEAGSLDQMLEKVAIVFEEEVDLAVDSLSSLLEPLIIVTLGIIIGSLVIAMYLPIFNLGAIV